MHLAMLKREIKEGFKVFYGNFGQAAFCLQLNESQAKVEGNKYNHNVDMPREASTARSVIDTGRRTLD